MTTPPNKKQLALALVPLIMVAGLLINTWWIVLFTDIEAIWKHYIGLLLFLPLPYLIFRNFKIGLLGTGIYLILGAFNLLILTPSIEATAYGLRIGFLNLRTPYIQTLPLGIFVLYLILNFNAFIIIYVDYKVKTWADATPVDNNDHNHL